MRPDAASVADGRRFIVLSASDTDGHPILGVRYEGVESSMSVWGAFSAFDFVLVNPGRREAVELTSRGGNEYSGHNLVLMGTRWYALTSDMTQISGTGVSPATLDDDWLDGAELHVTDWSPVGGYSVSTTPARVPVVS